MAGDWATVERRPRASRSSRVELFAGPRDGEARHVADLDAPIVFEGALVQHPAEKGGGREWTFNEVAPFAQTEGERPRYVYRRRRESSGSVRGAVVFDYMPPARV